MNLDSRRIGSLGRIRCPAIKGLPRDIVTMLHRSLVDLVLMRQSIRTVNIQLERSQTAMDETKQLLERLRKNGF